MKKIVIGVTALLCSFGVQAQNKATSDLLTSRINQATIAPQPKNQSVVQEFIDISERGEYIDASIKELFLCIDLPEDMVDSYCKNFSLSSGQWSDIDYANANRSGWHPGYHSMRLNSLARIYSNPESKHYQSPTLKNIIISGINYWHNAKLVCPNWWYNDIGVPKLMGPVYLLFKSELNPSQLKEAVRVMSRSTFSMTGQNKVAMAGNIVMRALLEDDMNLVTQARDSIISEIYTGTSEGLQFDHSFHQHGPMMQFGNYGLAYIGSMAYWGRIFADTDLAFDKNKTEIMSKYALDGIRWVVWRSEMDLASCGRQLFTNSARGKVHALAQAMINMAMLDPEHKALYTEFVELNQNNPKGENRLTGSKMFWRSDYLVNRAKNWYGSIRMSSGRTYGFEMTNSENLQGWYSADGVTYISSEGGEYTNISPVWNWKQLPGLTAQDNGKKLSTKYNFFSNQSDFVGGVASDNHSVATMRLNRDGLTALKSYFYINNMMVCLGASISSQNNLPTTTAIEQSLLKSTITYGNKSKQHTLNSGDSIKLTDTNWIHQNSIGYIILANSDVNLSSLNSTGSWSRIATFYKDMPQINQNIFKLVINHGTNPTNASYAYAVAPATTAKQTKELANNPTITVVENSANCQAVASTDGKTLEVVFHKPGSISTKGIYLTSNQAGVYVVTKTKDGYTISAADPTQKLQKLSGSIGTTKETTKPFSVTLPTINTAGSTTKFTI